MALAIAFSAAAAPPTRNMEQEWRAACTRDALTHCPLSALSGDRDRVEACMMRKLSKLSSRCRAVIDATPDGVDPNQPPTGPLIASGAHVDAAHASNWTPR